MQEFMSRLEGHLRDADSGEGQTSSVLILRKPFPGEGVLRQVREKVQSALPNSSVIFDEEHEP
jgi:hypothetical protein